MTNDGENRSTTTTCFIKVARDRIFRAFTDPDAIQTWQAPGDMTAHMHEFEGKAGGGYVMSLYYPESDSATRGKSGEREDRYTARFVEIIPPEKIVEIITFESDEPSFSDEMTMTVLLEESNGGTQVTIRFDNIPSGISLEDNELGTKMSLEKLTRYVKTVAAESNTSN